MTTEDESLDIPEEKSKSQRKREHQDLQAMAVRLLELSPANYAKVNLPPDVQDPVDLGRTLTKGARKRQIKFIAAKLQGEVAENVRESLAIIDGSHKQQVAHQHWLERTRDALIAGDNVLFEELAARYDGFDRQYVRQLIRNAQGNREKPPGLRAYRALFKYLQDL